MHVSRSPERLILAVIAGYPLVWLLGLRLFVWPVLGVLLLWSLLQRRGRVLAPRGFGLWLLFLAWTLLSVLTLDSVSRVLGWGYREVYYVTATAVLLALINVREQVVLRRQVASAVCALFCASVLLGIIGLVMPDVQIPTPPQWILPGAVQGVPFIADGISASFGGTAEFLGTTRPSAPYGYTNEWGAAMGVLIPLTVFYAQDLRSRRWRRFVWTVMAISPVPIVMSVNRGLWVSILAALLIVAVRAALARRVEILGAMVVAGSVLAAVVLATPLRDVILNRLNRPNLDTRETLIQQAFILLQESPVFGHGAPVEVTNVANTNDVSVGTHGQLWTILVSQGLPGVLFYTAFFATVLITTWRLSGRAWWLWAAVAVLAVQMPFYNAIPVPLVLCMVAVATMVRYPTWDRSVPADDLARSAPPSGVAVSVPGPDPTSGGTR